MWYDSIMARILSAALMLAIVPALLVLTATGCSEGAVLCQTSCGLKLAGPVPYRTEEFRGEAWWTCEQFERAEEIALDTYAVLAGPHDDRFNDGCGLIRGYTVVVMPEWDWKAPDGEEVSGLTYCDSKTILVNEAPPMSSSLTHEMGHAIQGCAPKGPMPARDGGTDTQYQNLLDHANWDRDGLYATDQWVGMLGQRDANRCSFYADGGVASADGYFDDAYSGPVPGFGPGDDPHQMCPGIPTH